MSFSFNEDAFSKEEEKTLEGLADRLGIGTTREKIPSSMEDNWLTVLILCCNKAGVEGSYRKPTTALAALEKVTPPKPAYNPATEQPTG